MILLEFRQLIICKELEHIVCIYFIVLGYPGFFYMLLICLVCKTKITCTSFFLFTVFINVEIWFLIVKYYIILYSDDILCFSSLEYSCEKFQRKYKKVGSLKRYIFYYCGQQFPCHICQGVFTRKANLQLHKAVGVLME